MPTLLTFAAGPAARASAAGATSRWPRRSRQLRRLYGPEVPDPVGAHVTAWQDDPFARGSYAYMTPGSRTRTTTTSPSPSAGLLHLAGEATWTDDPATVTAAFRSGERAAGAVIGHPVALEFPEPPR